MIGFACWLLGSSLSSPWKSDYFSVQNSECNFKYQGLNPLVYIKHKETEGGKRKNVHCCVWAE